MGLADAMMDSVLLVAITGQVRGWGCGLWWEYNNGDGTMVDDGTKVKGIGYGRLCLGASD